MTYTVETKHGAQWQPLGHFDNRYYAVVLCEKLKSREWRLLHHDTVIRSSAEDAKAVYQAQEAGK